MVESLRQPKEGDSDLRYEDMRVASTFTQAKELLKRNLQQYARKVGCTAHRLLQYLAQGKDVRTRTDTSKYS